MPAAAADRNVGAMIEVLGWLLNVTLLAWVLAEVVMQVRQYRMSGPAEITEWRSLGAIVLSLAVGWVLATLAKHELPGLRFSVDALAVALPLMWAGIAFRLWAIRTLGRFFRGVVHVQADHQVVRHGPYRWLRHPAYAGALVAVVGIALTFHNVASFVVYVACGAAGVLYRIHVEERVLLAALGADYEQYAATTARLVPRVW
jgi:protein-S-isoprenylcysteine O-methyltransferase Ste14